MSILLALIGILMGLSAGGLLPGVIGGALGFALGLCRGGGTLLPEWPALDGLRHTVEDDAWFLRRHDTAADAVDGPAPSLSWPPDAAACERCFEED